MDQQITISEEGGSDTLLQEVAVPGQNNVTEITWMIDRSGPGDYLYESATDRGSGEDYSTTSGRRDE